MNYSDLFFIMFVTSSTMFGWVLLRRNSCELL